MAHSHRVRGLLYMKTWNNYWLGVGLAALYILIASAQSVALNTWLYGVNVFLVVGLCFTIATVVFGLIGVIWQRSAYKVILKQWRPLFALNLVTLGNWLLYFFAVKFLEPSVAVTLTQGAGPVSMTLFTLLNREPVSWVTRICHGIICAAAVAMCIYVVLYRGDHTPYSRADTLLGIVLATACGVSITATLILSKRFAIGKVPAVTVLSVRFPLLILVCLMVLSVQQDIELTQNTFLITLLIALIGICASTYFLQKGVELAPPIAISTMLALSPLVVFAMQFSQGRAPFSLPILSFIMIITLVSIISILYEAQQIAGGGVANLTLASRRTQTK